MITKEHIGLFGEYYVAAEVCRRGHLAIITMGNRKKTDIIVDNDDKVFRVSVKTKMKGQWPKVKGIWQKNDVIVFIDCHDIENKIVPDSYILTVNDWKKVCKNKMKLEKFADIDDKNTIYWGEKGEQGYYYGHSVNVSDVDEYKDNWGIFEVK